MGKNVKNEEKIEIEATEADKSTEKTDGSGKAKLSREVVTYLIFGVLTTFVGWAVYFAIMMGGRVLLDIPSHDTTSGTYFALYSTAQVVQWICAVLFAFFTNRKWVFTEADKSKNVFAQLAAFAGGRVATFILDFVVTFFGGLALSKLIPAFNAFEIFGATFNLNEIAAKVFAAVLVIIGNYFFSKFLVFKKKKS